MRQLFFRGSAVRCSARRDVPLAPCNARRDSALAPCSARRDSALALSSSPTAGGAHSKRTGPQTNSSLRSQTCLRSCCSFFSFRCRQYRLLWKSLRHCPAGRCRLCFSALPNLKFERFLVTQHFSDTRLRNPLKSGFSQTGKPVLSEKYKNSRRFSDKLVLRSRFSNTFV